MGKVITEAPSYQHCIFCHKKQSDFNKHENSYFQLIDDLEKYGLSTLHCGINFTKAILKIASQVEIKQHACRGQNKVIREQRAKRNADKLWSELGIDIQNWFNVTGNGARKFFDNYDKVAEILEIPQFLVKDLGTIWRILVQSCSIDAEKFGHTCDLFIERFKFDASINWYEFSPTIHKILVHGRQCIEYFPVPIGWLSEGSFK